ncbi:hypothetical protein ACFSL4_01755 [Streptomyces caeni]|uniref:Ku domain-containing protein n=1 Tax=Streptomyces caeni TaxID=2307231 RepID=A0ABW4IKC7_9ACTN
MATIYRCLRAFALGANGITKVVPAGKVVSSDDPLFKGRQDLLADKTKFEPLDTYIGRSLGGPEQTSAAPGEKRELSAPAEPKRAPRPRKQAAKNGEEGS